MELLNGPSLWDARQSGMLTVERCLDTLARVCDALDSAHERGVIHRDVKPENVVLHSAPEGGTVVKVVDFGIAAVVLDDASSQRVRLTATHAIMGTPAYLAPERIAGEPYDGRSDVYAVGVMAYELLAARPPFDADSPVEALVLKLRQTPPSMRVTDRTIPEELDAVVLRTLRRNPAERPSALELMGMLDALRASLPADVLELAVKSTNLDEAETVGVRRGERILVRLTPFGDLEAGALRGACSCAPKRGDARPTPRRWPQCPRRTPSPSLPRGSRRRGPR